MNKAMVVVFVAEGLLPQDFLDCKFGKQLQENSKAD